MEGDEVASPPPSHDGAARRRDAACAAVDTVAGEARTLDELATGILSALADLPDVRRVGLGLCEGGGRRLRFVSSGQLPDLAWCHIDAYDDVPLTAVVRSGEPILAGLDDLAQRFPGLVARQRQDATRALAAVPLPGADAALGGLVLFYDRAQEFTDHHALQLTELAACIAGGVLRLQAGDRPEGATATPSSDDSSGQRAGVVLDGEPRSSGVARRFLRTQLAAWGVDDETSQDAQLCVSELVTNVVIHAHSAAHLHVRLECDVLTVRVADQGGPGLAGVEPAGAEEHLEVFGRGLLLVAAIADRWGSHRDAVGTTVWFSHDLGVDRSDAAS